MTWRWWSVWSGLSALKTIRELPRLVNCANKGGISRRWLSLTRQAKRCTTSTLPSLRLPRLGTPDGREIVDRETFNAKIAGFEESNKKALENAVKAADDANKATDAAINAVKDPAIRAALQALIGRKPDPKGGK
jgi:hypothetical protein